jgi:hypothetical protein
MKKIFGISLSTSVCSKSAKTNSQDKTQTPITTARRSDDKMPMAEIKHHMAQCLYDMVNIEAERLRYTIGAASSVDELWLLRSGLYQAISKHHSQSEAALRINALLAYFKRWIPQRQLAQI